MSIIACARGMTRGVGSRESPNHQSILAKDYLLPAVHRPSDPAMGGLAATSCYRKAEEGGRWCAVVASQLFLFSLLHREFYLFSCNEFKNFMLMRHDAIQL